MNSPPPSYGTARDRGASVSFADISTAARKLMAAGKYPSVHAVRLELKRGSTTTIAEAMQRFWKDQGALDAGNPVSLTRLPPEFADAAVELWEQALRLSLQTAKANDTAAHEALQALERDTDARGRSLEAREKEWDLAARMRERALNDTREQVNLLLKELGNATAEMRARDLRIGDLEVQLEDHRRQLASVISKSVSRIRAMQARKPSPIFGARPKTRVPALAGARARARATIKRKSPKPKKKSDKKRR